MIPTLESYVVDTRVQSTRSDRTYTPKYSHEAHGWICNCEAYNYQRIDCRHIIEAKRRILERINQIQSYFLTKNDKPSEGAFKSFEEVRDFAEEDEECKLIREAIIDYAHLTGRITADNIHDITGDRITKNRSLYGAILNGLARQGILKFNAYIRSERDTSHHRRIVEFIYAGDGGGAYD